jgi:two-component system phosphate regulon response regulator PhoB
MAKYVNYSRMRASKRPWPDETRYRIKIDATAAMTADMILADANGYVLLDLMIRGEDSEEVINRFEQVLNLDNVQTMMTTSRGPNRSRASLSDPVFTIAKISALGSLRANSVNHQKRAPIRLHDLIINPEQREVLAAGKRIDLSYMEFEILRYLAERPGWVFTPHQILNAAKGWNHKTKGSSVRMHIVNLRKKLGSFGSSIEAVRGIGYRINVEPLGSKHSHKANKSISRPQKRVTAEIGGADRGKGSNLIQFKHKKQSPRKQKTHQLKIAASGYDRLRYTLLNPPDLILFNVMIGAKDGKAVLDLIESAFLMKDVQPAVMQPEAISSVVSNAAYSGCRKDDISVTHPKVSLARISAVLSKKDDTLRSTTSPGCRYNVVIHPCRREVSINERALSLSHTEFEVLRFLAENPNTVCTRSQILEAARGQDHNTQEKTVNIHIMSLRRKLGKARQLIETVKQMGYRINTNCTILS